MKYRTTYLNPDNTYVPKNAKNPCGRCNRNIKDGSKSRSVHLINGGLDVLHPDDESKYVSDSGDLGFYSVGMDCAKAIGLEFTHE